MMHGLDFFEGMETVLCHSMALVLAAAARE